MKATEEKLTKLKGWILQEDAMNPMDFFFREGLTIGEYIEHRFRMIHPEYTSAIIWDMGAEHEAYQTYLKGSLPLRDSSTLQRWAKEGIDMLDELVRASHQRGMMALWNHRIAEVDGVHPTHSGHLGIGVPFDDPSRENYLKKQHPDWLNDCWWPQGLWNLACAPLREHKLKFLREIAENYDIDGMQIDFARHTPFLPPGQEWEHREHATDFLRSVRKMLREVGEKCGHPMLLLVRIGENIAGNHMDGIDIETWIAEGLVDAIVPGGRTVHIDFEAFQKLPGIEKVKIIPSWDANHTGNGIHRPPLEYLRGVFGNFAEQGADGVSLFNMTDHNGHKPFAQIRSVPFERTSFAGGFKEYRAERRGEYPWAGNYVYRSDDKALPVTCGHGGGAVIPLEIYCDTPAQTMSVMVDGMQSGDLEQVMLDGITVPMTAYYAAVADEHLWRESDRPSHPQAEFDLGGRILKQGLHHVTLIFRANIHPVLFTIWGVVIRCSCKQVSTEKEER